MVESFKVTWVSRGYRCLDGEFRIGTSTYDNQNHWFWIDSDGEYWVVTKRKMTPFAGVIFLQDTNLKDLWMGSFWERAVLHLKLLEERFNIQK